VRKGLKIFKLAVFGVQVPTVLIAFFATKAERL
jgi:hypothetical protein